MVGAHVPIYLHAEGMKPSPAKRFCKLQQKLFDFLSVAVSTNVMFIVSNSVGLDIPDYVMTNDDGVRRSAGSRHTADMVSLIKRWLIAECLDFTG